MDRFDAMRVFARIVERRSFIQAADDLGLPRSSMTDAVKGLESRLGVRLLERTTRHPIPVRRVAGRSAGPSGERRSRRDCRHAISYTRGSMRPPDTTTDPCTTVRCRPQAGCRPRARSSCGT